MIKTRLSNAHDAYIVANTPRYLYTRLRDDSDVQDLARLESADSLVNAYKKYVDAPRSNETNALAYAMLVALGLKGSDEARAALATLEVSPLEWGDRVRRIITDSDLRVQVVNAKPATPTFRRPSIAGRPDTTEVEIRYDTR